jgi:hypothetical protein
MSNMVERLRDWRSVHLARLHLLMEEAADEMERVQAVADKRGELAVERRREIERLRNGSVESRETVRQVSQQENSTTCPHVVGRTTHYCSLTPLTLTDAERECLEWAAKIAGNCEDFDRADTLRGLLDRLGGAR